MLQIPTGETRPGFFIARNRKGDTDTEQENHSERIKRLEQAEHIVNQIGLPPEYWKAIHQARMDEMSAAIADSNNDGSAGSGNWGHIGVHGVRGGSAPGGGHDFRKAAPSGGYTSEAKKKTEELSKAKGTKEYAAVKSKWQKNYETLHTPNIEMRQKGIKPKDASHAVILKKEIEKDPGFEKIAKIALPLKDPDKSKSKAMAYPTSEKKPVEKPVEKTVEKKPDEVKPAKKPAEKPVEEKKPETKTTPDTSMKGKEASTPEEKEAIFKAGGMVKNSDGTLTDGEGYTHWEDSKYDKEVKKNATFCSSVDETMDKFGSQVDEVKAKTTSAQFEAVKSYTGHFSDVNETLRGYEYGKGYLGPHKGIDDLDLDTHGGTFRKKIDNMTAYIDQSTFGEDINLRRGCDKKALSGMFNQDLTGLSTEQIAQKLMPGGKGVTGRDGAFMSCGAAKGTGFDDDVQLNVYAPAGTRMAYLNPFSEYKGHENEMLIQRGTSYRVTSVWKDKAGKTQVNVEVAAQIPKGSKIQDEPFKAVSNSEVSKMATKLGTDKETVAAAKKTIEDRGFTATHQNVADLLIGSGKITGTKTKKTTSASMGWTASKITAKASAYGVKPATVKKLISLYGGDETLVTAHLLKSTMPVDDIDKPFS